MLFKLPNLALPLVILTQLWTTRPWISESRKFWLVESGIRGKFCLGSPESWALESAKQLKESGIPLTIAIRNPSSTNKESWIHGMEFRIQDCLEFRYIEWRIVVDLFLNKKFKDFSRTFKDTFPIFQGLHSVQKEPWVYVFISSSTTWVILYRRSFCVCPFFFRVLRKLRS